MKKEEKRGETILNLGHYPLSPAASKGRMDTNILWINICKKKLNVNVLIVGGTKIICTAIACDP